MNEEEWFSPHIYNLVLNTETISCGEIYYVNIFVQINHTKYFV